MGVSNVDYTEKQVPPEPPISRALIEWLEAIAPRRPLDIKATGRELWMTEAKTAFVEMLRAKFNAQQRS